MYRLSFAALAAALLITGCATSPLGRSQLMLFSPQQMAQMGDATYQDILHSEPQTHDPAVVNYVRCVATAVVSALPPSENRNWQIAVFKKSDPNAFALPGGNIGVNTGLLAVAKDQSQLATVIGHEIAHVIAGHANERLSTQYATETGLQVLSAIAGAPGPQKNQIFALLGVGAQVGILLPFSRQEESEADLLGLDLVAKAGFDPRASIALWQNMGAYEGGNNPPEFLSTHPSGGTRIKRLEERMPKAMAIYEQARAQGAHPDCHQ